MPHRSTPSQGPQRSVNLSKSSVLAEGTCFRAARVAAKRSNARIFVTAEDVIVVAGDGDAAKQGGAPSRARASESKPSHKDKERSPPVEKRKIMVGTSFTVPSPEAHLVKRQQGNRAPFIDLEGGRLPEARFDPMPFKPGVGYAEVNAAEVLLGLDPSVGGLWISPSAWEHVVAVREGVLENGGVFLADFDLSVGKWAKVRSMYVCPSPSMTLDFVHVCKTRPSAFCSSTNVVLPLACDGGRLYTRRFAPSASNLGDPA